MSGTSGDGWVEGPDGARYWGRYGAAGLLAVSPEHEVLLQHRAVWSHFGGTWGMPGGARHEDETPIEAAVREAGEEAGVPAGALTVRFTSVLDLGYWSYTTVVADAAHRFEPAVSDPESIAVAWIAIDEVAALPLHPRFAEAWPGLRDRL
ncbi:8-oxo-dGTP pyrophosphatase MutT (NUDIX family) [Agromyces terreus]|uniref:8-oxo-dGTP pyrophosphatase MutT (NUDIX family) n=1 Tax=Agromyces terreus TaxID=424795 RepID=A0A9X2KCJ1_9MICO|nr:NUDIX hydrolase [Agromyces terreus]MCP2371679.1 8-oxo-dGTP pyrophosphatase MutT (NUDIX family) [Agromyces terreus]